MTHHRMSNLALLHIHYDKKIDFMLDGSAGEAKRGRKLKSGGGKKHSTPGGRAKSGTKRRAKKKGNLEKTRGLTRSGDESRYGC